MTDPELRSLVRQGQRWHLAGSQDANPVVRHLHLNYAHTHFELAHHGATRARIRRLTGVNIDRELAQVAAEQEHVQLQLLAPGRTAEDAKRVGLGCCGTLAPTVATFGQAASAPGVTLDQVAARFDWTSALHEGVRMPLMRRLRPGWVEEVERVMAFGQERTRWLQGLLQALGPATAYQTRDYTFAIDRLNSLGKWVQEVQATAPLRTTSSWDWNYDLPAFVRQHDLYMGQTDTSIAALRERAPQATPQPTQADEKRAAETTTWTGAAQALGIGLTAYGAWKRDPSTIATGGMLWVGAALMTKVGL